MSMRPIAMAMAATLGCSTQPAPNPVAGHRVTAPVQPTRADADAPAPVSAELHILGDHVCIVGTVLPRCELGGKRVALDVAIDVAIPDRGGVCTLRQRGAVACGAEPQGATVVTLEGPARALVGGGAYACALLEAGSVTCWSRTTPASGVPALLGLPGGVGRVAAVATGTMGIVVVDDRGLAHYGSLSGASIGEPEYGAISVDMWTPLLADVERVWMQGPYGCVLTRSRQAHCFDTAGAAVRAEAFDGARALALPRSVGPCALLADGVRCFEPGPTLGKPIVVDPATAYVPGSVWPQTIVAVTSDGDRMCAAGGDGTVACTSNAPR